MILHLPNPLRQAINQIICVIKNCEKRLCVSDWRNGNSPACVPREQSDRRGDKE